VSPGCKWPPPVRQREVANDELHVGMDGEQANAVGRRQVIGEAAAQDHLGPDAIEDRGREGVGYVEGLGQREGAVGGKRHGPAAGDGGAQGGLGQVGDDAIGAGHGGPSHP
jgi:hypothetical protein